MKKVLLLAFMSVLFQTIKAQEPLSFEKVIKVDSISKDKIHSVIKEWFALNSNSKHTLEVDDRNTGLIIANLSTDYNSIKGFFYDVYRGYIKYKIKIQIKDGRYKVTVDNFVHHCNPLRELGLIKTGEYTGGIMNKSYDKKVWVDLQEKSKNIADTLFTTFETLKFKEESDNW